MTKAVNLATVGSNANSGGSLITSGTAVASTSGTSIDFTGIPSWVKRITVMFSGVSTNGTSFKQIQIGSGSVTTTGYLSEAAAGASTTSSTTGFVIYANTASDTISGIVVLTLLTSNTWISSHSVKSRNDYSSAGGGDIALSGVLDRVRITTVNGTDTFDAGSINILYE